MAKHEFRVDGIDFMETEKGYFYRIEDGKKIRIKKQEYDEAFEDLCHRTDEQLDLYVEESGMDEQVDEWMQEINEAREAQAREQAESDKMAEDAINGKSKPAKVKKPRRSKDIAHESHGITLTTKQVRFIQMIPNDDFYEHGLDSTLWIDCLCDTVAGEFNPMAVGAMVSTLREKELVFVDVDRINGKKCKYLGFTPLGKEIAKELGLN
jgi:uncharacterized protein YdbL (DUF1318 family)